MMIQAPDESLAIPYLDAAPISHTTSCGHRFTVIFGTDDLRSIDPTIPA